MKIRHSYLGAIATVGVLLASNALGDAINLTQNAEVRSVATYTYYSRNSSTFATKFYPGPPHTTNTTNANYNDNGLDEPADTPAPISFLTGDLTNTAPTSSSFVGGWRGVIGITSGNNGQFDILFDLGDTYTITEVIINYRDTTGFRWHTAGDAQAVFTAVSLTSPAPQDSDFTPFATATFASNANNINATFNGADVQARYVLFRGAATAGGGSGNDGGILNDITIMGSTIPEPGTMALVLGAAPLIATRLRSTATKR